MKSTLNNKRAFTLTESVVAVFLLTIVWLAGVNVIVVSRACGSLAKHKMQAIYVIQQKIESLRKLSFSSIAGSTSTVTLDTRGTPDTTSGDLTATQTVTVSTPDSYYKKVLVQLSWNESFFGRRKTVYEYGGTYIANDSQAN